MFPNDKFMLPKSYILFKKKDCSKLEQSLLFDVITVVNYFTSSKSTSSTLSLPASAEAPASGPGCAPASPPACC